MGDPKALLLGGLVLAACGAFGGWSGAVRASEALGAMAPDAVTPDAAQSATAAGLPIEPGEAPLQIARENAGAQMPPSQPRPREAYVAEAPPRSFVALGDSLTAWAFAPGGCLPSSTHAWPAVLAQIQPELKLLHNSGAPGDTTAQMVARFRADVLAYRPDMLFVMGGANDIGQYRSSSALVANLRAIVRSARSHGIEVVLLTIPPNNQFTSAGDRTIRATNELLLRMGAEEGVLVVDVYSSLIDSRGRLAGPYAAVDGLHLTIDAEQAIAQAVSDSLDAVASGPR